MKRPSLMARARRKPITAADVGKYLKGLSALNRDAVTGNPAMSEALAEIASILMMGKSLPAVQVLERHVDQQGFEFEEEFDFRSLTIDQVKEILSRKDLNKNELSIIGTDRFGIAKSRLDRMSREELIKTIFSAVQHEESLAIISEEAQRHSRSS